MRFNQAFSLFLVCFLQSLTACTQPSAAQLSLNPYCRGNSNLEKLSCRLAKAQQAKNFSEVEALTGDITQALGSQAGVPDVPDQFNAVVRSGRKLTAAEARKAFTPYAKRLRHEAWWLSRPDPTTLDVPLRFLASVITGSLAARRAGAEYSDYLLKMAESAGDYLLWAQKQGGHGLFPFPASRGGKARPFQVMEKFLIAIERQGRLSEVVVNGWIVNDLGMGDGGLQFDNGLCGVAMLELYEATANQKYLQAALDAANWAIAQPVVPNWNYNSYSVYLLAHTYRVTGDRRYLESAKQKARLGLYPGQLRTGPNKGRWLDAHNARLVYHYAIIRGLGALVAVLPQNDPDLPKAVNVLSLALQARNGEIIAKGVSHPTTVLEVLSELQLELPPSSGRLPDQGRTAALDLIGRYVSAKILDGNLPVEPGAWGLFLETLTQQE